MIKKASLAAVLLLSATGTYAACSKNDIVGRWNSEVSFTNVSQGTYWSATCFQEYNKKREFIGGACFGSNGENLIFNKDPGQVVTIGSDCSMKGELTDTTGYTFKINAHVSRGKDSAVGTFTANPANTGVFSAVRN